VGDSVTQRVALPFFGLDPLPWVRPAAGGFPTWYNQTPAGKSTATLVDNANGLPLVMDVKQDMTQYLVTAVVKSKGAAPWTISTGQAAFGVCHSGLFINYPLVLVNSVSKKAILLSWYLGNASDGGRVTLIKVPDITVAAASITESDLGYGFPAQDYFEWFRVVNDGTNLNFFISPEGQLWLPIFVEPLATFIGSIDQIGYGIERLKQNPVGQIDVAALLWNWVET